MDYWEMRDEGATLLHYWNSNVKLCSTVKHNILQAAPPIEGNYGDVQQCTACIKIMEQKLNFE